MANYLRIVFTATYCKFIVWIGQQASSLGPVILFLVSTQIYKNSDYEPHCPFYGGQYYLPDQLHEYCQLPLEFIACEILPFKTSN